MKMLKRFLSFTLALTLLFSISVLVSSCKKKPAPSKPVASKPKKEAPEPEKYYWPLTGIEVADKAVLSKRPISVKIENSQSARPQTGLNSADIVYETMVEGGMTRFNALFMSNIPKELGPIRSARLSDLWIVPQYDAIFYYSGSNSQVYGRIKEKQLSRFNEDNSRKQYHRISSRKAPHNLYFNTLEIENSVKDAGYRRDVKSEMKGLEFGTRAASLETTLTASEVKINISNYAKPTWKFDPTQRVYLRSEGSTPLNDAQDDSQIRTTNIVVMYAVYTQQTMVDKAHNNTWDTTMGGTGKVQVVKDGQVIEGTWTADEKTPPSFKDAAGKPITLNPGNTWFEVVPVDRSVEFVQGLK